MFLRTGSSRHGHTGPDAWEPPSARKREWGLRWKLTGLLPTRRRDRHGGRGTQRESGEGRTRTGDTPVFSRVLYQLSYLAAGGASLARRRAKGREALDERVDEIRLLQHRVGARLGDREWSCRSGSPVSAIRQRLG